MVYDSRGCQSLNEFILERSGNEDVVWRNACLTSVCNFAPQNSAGGYLEVAFRVDEDG
jgi:hypothetical protein